MFSEGDGDEETRFRFWKRWRGVKKRKQGTGDEGRAAEEKVGMGWEEKRVGRLTSVCII